MKHLSRLQDLRLLMPGRLAASAAAVAAVVAGAAGTAAGQGNASSPMRAHATHALRGDAFKRPKLKHGVLTIEGTNADDKITVRLEAGNPDMLQVDVGIDGSPEFTFRREDIARIAVDARRGDDLVRIDDSNGAFTDSIPTTIDGGDGNDTLAGGQGVERLLGGDGNDSIDGNRGNDVALMGAGDDTFVWDPGDGSDTVEGQDGTDTMLFNGAGGDERVALSANGNRLRFLRDPGTITMDTSGVEQVDFNALGGADTVTVNDLTGTDVSKVNLDLAGALGGSAGDGGLDQVIVNGTDGNDTIKVSGDASAVAVSGLSAKVAIQHQEPTDKLTVAGRGGNDDISAAALAAGVIAVTLDGGTGDDAIFGGLGAETLLGGDGNDTIDGFKGNDRAAMGTGDDTFVWDPGDGSDVVEGEAGADTMSFIGANVPERVDVSANGNRVRFFRDAGTITMDLAGVERIDFAALGGADVVTVNDLTGTDLTSLNVDLEGAPGSGDGAADRVIVNATDGDDTINVNGDAGGVKVSGLAATIVVLHSEAAKDRLEVNNLEGRDSLDSGGLAAGAIQLFVDGVLAA